MKVNWSGVWNWTKFHLGAECVAEYDGKWVVTKSVFGYHYCLDRETNYWWSEGFWGRNCTFPTREAAEHRRRYQTEAEAYVKPQLRACK